MRTLLFCQFLQTALKLINIQLEKCYFAQINVGLYLCKLTASFITGKIIVFLLNSLYFISCNCCSVSYFHIYFHHSCLVRLAFSDVYN